MRHIVSQQVPRQLPPFELTCRSLPDTQWSFLHEIRHHPPRPRQRRQTQPPAPRRVDHADPLRDRAPGPERRSAASAHRRPARLHHRLLRGRPDLLSRWQHRRPGNQRHGQRPGDDRGPPAGAVGGTDPRGGPGRRRTAPGAGVDADRRRRRRGGHRHRRYQGRPPRQGGQALHQYGGDRRLRPRPGDFGSAAPRLATRY